MVCTSCYRQDLPLKKNEATTQEVRINHYIRELTSTEMAGRRGGTSGEALASMYLAGFMQKAGLETAGEKDTYFQTFPIKSYETVLVKKRMTFRNVSGKVAGWSENILGLLPGRKKEVIVVSAHYDHLGVVDNKIYPGANDNASGVAVVLELINQLKDETPPYSILFAFWGSEEMGLLGSRYFCNNPTIELVNIKCVLNLDSVGNLRNDKNLLGWGLCKEEPCRNIMEKLAEDGWQIEWENNTSHSSDHNSFIQEGISGVTLLSPEWLVQNHTVHDTIKNIKYAPLEELVIAIRKALLT